MDLKNTQSVRSASLRAQSSAKHSQVGAPQRPQSFFLYFDDLRGKKVVDIANGNGAVQPGEFLFGGLFDGNGPGCTG